jgi:hypothetical protein
MNLENNFKKTTRRQIKFEISAALHHPVNGHCTGANFRAYHGIRRLSNLMSKTNILVLVGDATSFATRPRSL